MLDLFEILYPNGDMNHEWSSDTLAAIGYIVDAYSLRDGTTRE